MSWLGNQGVNGAIYVIVMVQAIWTAYVKVGNHIALDLSLTTEGMSKFVLFPWINSVWADMCPSYFIFCIIQLPLRLIPSIRISWLFVVKMRLLHQSRHSQS